MHKLKRKPSKPVILTKPYDAFISHASQDKDDIVRPLVELLEEFGLKVWYDEYTMEVGDRLSLSIEKGLTESNYGIIVLSQHFFAKHWTQVELDLLAKKESNGEKVILPVWHNISAEEIRQHSSVLADRVSVESSEGLYQVATRLFKTIKGSIDVDMAIRRASEAFSNNENKEFDETLSDAIVILEEALESHPDSLELREELVTIHGLADNNKKQNNYIRELIELRPTEIDYYQDLSHVFFKQEHYEDAKSILMQGINNIKRVLQRRPKNKSLHWNLMQAHIYLGDFYADDFTDDLLHFEEYPEDERQDRIRAIEQYENALGIVEKQEFRFHYSIRRYELGYLSIEEKLAVLYSELGEWTKAVHLLECLIKKMHSENDMEKAYKREVYKSIGKIYINQRKYNAAIKFFRLALDVQINDFELRDLLKRRESRTHYLMGKCYKEKGQYEKAIKTYKDGLNLNTDDTEELALLNFSVGYAYDQLEDYHEAFYYYKKSLELVPNDAIAHNDLGRVYSKLGQGHKAKEEYRKALQIDPNYGTARDNLRIIEKRYK